MSRSTCGRRRWTVGAAILISALALTLADTAAAKRQCAPVKRSSSVVTLAAHGITAYGGLPCRAARVVVARFFGVMFEQDEYGCLSEAFTPNGCRIDAWWICWRAKLTVRGRCARVAGGRAVRWHERDIEHGAP